MADERFEDRHRELRDVVERYAEAWKAAEIDGSSLIAADNRLLYFEKRTGPLVDDLVAAVRRDFELLDMRMDEQQPRMRQEMAMQRLAHRQVLRAALAALDEAGRAPTT